VIYFEIIVQKRKIKTEKNISIETATLQNLVGINNRNLNIIQKSLDVIIFNRGDNFRIVGEEIALQKAEKTLKMLEKQALNNEEITPQVVRNSINLVNENKEDKIKELGDGICLNSKGKIVKPKTLGQKEYITAISENTITFGIGPAGTGKTFLAIAMAVKAYRAGSIKKIVLTRPVVEAGESLGFLPGDLQEKIDPYLHPLYDALFELFGAEIFKRLTERNSIEIAPLAYMRGRTLEDAFIILDEAQNTTNEQLKMFLTRLGLNSKMVITGDVTQIDLPSSKKSGLVIATEILNDIEDIAFHRFTASDVVRHKLVQDIINAYEKL
jgi:phosphate starvation-inducible PhoH-like protein